MMGDAEVEMKERWDSRAFSIGQQYKKVLKTKWFYFQETLFSRIKELRKLCLEQLSKTNSGNRGHPFSVEKLDRKLGQSVGNGLN